jgi:putative transcriptional regulator
MSIAHHPPEEILAAFAAGNLDEAQRLVLSIHASQCPSCRRVVCAMELLAGKALETVEPSPMSEGAFDALMAQIETEPRPTTQAERAVLETRSDNDLPNILRQYRIGKRRRVAPGVSMRPILLPKGGSRAFLLESAPGTRMLEHSHTGTELTCVLRGNFCHQGGRFGPGDFDFGDVEVDHRPTVDSDGPCLCLVAMAGDLKMKGFIGRLISPFVRL